MGTLEALLDNLDKKKGDQRDNVFDHGRQVNHAGFENDSLDEISSLSGLSSSLNSSVAVGANIQTNVSECCLLNRSCGKVRSRTNPTRWIRTRNRQAVQMKSLFRFHYR